MITVVCINMLHWQTERETERQTETERERERERDRVLAVCNQCCPRDKAYGVVFCIQYSEAGTSPNTRTLMVLTHGSGHVLVLFAGQTVLKPVRKEAPAVIKGIKMITTHKHPHPHTKKHQP